MVKFCIKIASLTGQVDICYDYLRLSKSRGNFIEKKLKDASFIRRGSKATRINYRLTLIQRNIILSKTSFLAKLCLIYLVFWVSEGSSVTNKRSWTKEIELIYVFRNFTSLNIVIDDAGYKCTI